MYWYVLGFQGYLSFLGLGGSSPPKFVKNCFWGGIPPSIFWLDIVSKRKKAKRDKLQLIICTIKCLNYKFNTGNLVHTHLSKTISYLISKIRRFHLHLEFGGECSPPKFGVFQIWGGIGNWWGGIPPQFPPLKYPCWILITRFLIRLFNLV